MKTKTNLLLFSILMLLSACTPEAKKEDEGSSETALFQKSSLSLCRVSSDRLYFISAADSVYEYKSSVLTNITPDFVVGKITDAYLFSNYFLFITNIGEVFQFEPNQRKWISRSDLGDVYSTVYYLNYNQTSGKLYFTSPGSGENTATYTKVIDFPVTKTSAPTNFSIKIDENENMNLIKSLGVNSNLFAVIGTTVSDKPRFVYIDNENKKYSYSITKIFYEKLYPLTSGSFLYSSGLLTKGGPISVQFLQNTEKIVGYSPAGNKIFIQTSTGIFIATVTEGASGLTLTNKQTKTISGAFKFLGCSDKVFIYQFVADGKVIQSAL